MPRRARIDAPGALHHIIGRGIERKKIFLDDGDRDNFVKRLSTILSGTETSCLGLLGGEGIWYLKTPRSHALA